MTFIKHILLTVLPTVFCGFLAYLVATGEFGDPERGGCNSRFVKEILLAYSTVCTGAMPTAAPIDVLYRKYFRA